MEGHSILLGSAVPGFQSQCSFGAMTIFMPLNLKWDVINMLGYRGEQLTQRDTVTK